MRAVLSDLRSLCNVPNIVEKTKRHGEIFHPFAARAEYISKKRPTDSTLNMNVARNVVDDKATDGDPFLPASTHENGRSFITRSPGEENNWRHTKLREKEIGILKTGS